MPDLRSSLQALASSFAAAVLDAIKGASIEELVSESTTKPTASKAPASKANGSTPKPTTTAKVKPSGHLARRTPEQVAKVLADVHGLLKAKGSMRSEDIRAALKIDKRAMPRVLKLGLEHKTIKAKGVKRSTTYSAA